VERKKAQNHKKTLNFLPNLLKTFQNLALYGRILPETSCTHKTLFGLSKPKN